MVELLRRIRREYSGGEDRPLGGYVAALTAFGAYASAWAAAVRLTGSALPERPRPGDIALTSVATFRLSRLLTKSAVTSPMRAAFTTYEGPQGPAELSESPREDGHHAAGELLTCPFCMSVWVATAFTAGQALWPRGTRAVMAALAATAGADVLQLSYSMLTDRATGGGGGGKD
jgi:alkylhydroperoxidase family enzyme